jgi:hypothetical protein
MLGLNWTGHMSFLTGQDQTPKFAGQVLADRTKSGLVFLNILHGKYGDFWGLLLIFYYTDGFTWL